MTRFKGRALKATKDPLDLRDLMYEGSLVELPPWIDNRGKVPFVLDQGKEGACTGFGLASVVNFLLHNASGARQLKRSSGASARMLYEMAKRYDEWEGADYDGSSIRGAMKGWHKHGVCSESHWPYRVDDRRPRLTSKRQDDALARPLGNYFRVRHLHLSHMHSALAEVGILYASGDVHAGWFDPDPATGLIEFHPTVEGGHAFSIVGYDEEGFWVQNSWDRDWGINGFGKLHYDDWLENGYDCWVARTGVVTKSRVMSGTGGKLGRVFSFDYLPHEAAVTAEIKPHLVNLGNNGRLSDSGRYQTDTQDLDEIFKTHLPAATEGWSGTPRLLLYAHGGLNNEKASAARVASLKPYFLANHIYPIHFMWETGVWESIRGMVSDVFRHPRFGGIWDDVKDRMQDLADEGIELAVRGLGKPLWSEMKENGTGASADGGGADLLAGRIANYPGELELHLVGHSAGSILLSNLVPILAQWGLRAKTLSLFAPACTTGLFEEKVLPNFGRRGCVDRMTIFNLSEDAERDDNVAKVYNKSLLYLVSEAFEKKRKQPILGMDHFLRKDEVVSQALGAPVRRSKPTTIYSRGGARVGLASKSKSHGGFDNDADTLNSTLRIIRGTNQLLKPFPN